MLISAEQVVVLRMRCIMPQQRPQPNERDSQWFMWYCYGGAVPLARLPCSQAPHPAASIITG